MNFGLLMLALMLVGGVGLGIILIANAPNAAYVDTYGTTTTEATNLTQSNLTASTSPLSGAVGGLALVFGFFVVVGAFVFIAKAVSGGHYGQGKR